MELELVAAGQPVAAWPHGEDSQAAGCIAVAWPHVGGSQAAGCTAELGRAAMGPSFLSAEVPAVEDIGCLKARQRTPVCRMPRIAAAALAAGRTGVLLGGCNPAAARLCRSSLRAQQD